MTDNLQDIIKGCVAGKQKAQTQLFKVYSRKLFGVCMLYTKDPSAAEDVLQEGFIKIFKNISKFAFKGSFEGWMRRIMINAALERYRKNHHLYPVEEIEAYIEEFSADDIIGKISADDLMKLIRELSPKYRMVFSLYAIDGYSHQEIAKMLNISEGTSKSNLSRARKLLQEKVLKFYNISNDEINLKIVDK